MLPDSPGIKLSVKKEKEPSTFAKEMDEQWSKECESKDIIEQYIDSKGNIHEKLSVDNVEGLCREDENKNDIPTVKTRRNGSDTMLIFQEEIESHVKEKLSFNRTSSIKSAKKSVYSNGSSRESFRMDEKYSSLEEVDSEDDVPLSELRQLLQNSNLPVAIKKRKRYKSRKVIYKCHLCAYESHIRNSILIHIKGVHMKLKEFKCELCSFAAVSASCLKQHMKGKHMPLKKWQCDLCEFVTTSRSSLKGHRIVIHKVEGGMKCQFCETYLASSYTLQQHLNSVHLGMKNNKCKLCDFSCGLQCNLTRHMRTVHSEKKTHPCHICSFATFSSSDLKTHINGVHLKLKTHKCHLCDYAGALKGNLTRHLKTVHYKNQRNKCSFCGFGCLHKYILKDHIERVHAPPTKKCNHCGKLFGSEIALKQHVNITHLKDQGFSCGVCEYRSYRKCDVDKHFRTHMKVKRGYKRKLQKLE